MSLQQSDIARGFEGLGLGRGDAVLVHSSLSSFGHVEGGAETVVQAFLHVLGESGTLLVPTFGEFGAITEAVRCRPDAFHSIHPRASVAAVGGRARELCADHWKAELAHGEGTPYVRLADLGGYVCLIGVDQDRNTSLHTVESLLHLPYLKTTAAATFSTPEGEVTKSWPFFPGPHRDFIGLDRILRDRGAMRIARVGDSMVRLIKSREMMDCLLEVGRRDPAFALCENPNCQDCVTQRTDLRRDQFASEGFTVAVAASLAGTTTDEIAASCKAAGIARVELDHMGGTPVDRLEPESLAETVDELRRKGCRVVSLRSAAADGDGSHCVRLAAACGINRAVVPLTDHASALARAAAEASVSLSFFNVDSDSPAVLAAMRSLRADGSEAGLTFNAASFARAGEKPFLTSYRNKLKLFIDQLDVEDCTFAGAQTSLAGGNAEIKELVSILRCSSFSGLMVLASGNREVADVRATAVQFEDLLLAM